MCHISKVTHQQNYEYIQIKLSTFMTVTQTIYYEPLPGGRKVLSGKHSFTFK